MLASASCKNEFCTLVALAVLKVLHTKFMIKFLTSFLFISSSISNDFKGICLKKYYPKLTVLIAFALMMSQISSPCCDSDIELDL